MKTNRVAAAANPNITPPKKVVIKVGCRIRFFIRLPTRLDISPITSGVISRLIPVIELILIMRSGNTKEIKLPVTIPEIISRRIIIMRFAGVLSAASTAVSMLSLAS